MPSRPVCVAILVFWAFVAGKLVRDDVLPDFWISPPPDLRSIAAAEEAARPSEWELAVAEDNNLKALRNVGRAMTRSNHRPDGGTELVGQIWFDSGGLLKGTPFQLQHSERLDAINRMLIDASGNLKEFHSTLHSSSDNFELLKVDGEVKNGQLGIEARGPTGEVTFQKSLPYEAGGMIQSAIGPIDRLPGLQVGQRWMTRVVSPLTGKVEEVKFEVTRKHVLQWDNEVVTTLEVVQHMSPFTVRAWVRRDGLVLRQEIPFPFVKLVLSRIPERGNTSQAEVKAP